MLCRLEGRSLSSQRVTSLVLLLTIHDHLYILDKTVDHLQSLDGSHLGLLTGEPIQPLQHHFDVLLSKKFLPEFFCAALSQVLP